MKTFTIKTLFTTQNFHIELPHIELHTDDYEINLLTFKVQKDRNVLYASNSLDWFEFSQKLAPRLIHSDHVGEETIEVDE